MKTIENLVFKGGGILGIAYAGAIEVLEQEDIIQGVKRVAGTSVGALISALLSLNYSSKEMRQIMEDTDFKRFLDRPNPLLISKSYGIYSGDFLFNWIKELIEKKTGDANITFAQLKAMGFKDLHVFSTDLSTIKLQELSHQTAPDCLVSEAIRSSMSIPMIFKAWKFSNSQPNAHIYLDGGVMSNYPILAFKDMDRTMGFFLYNTLKGEVLDYDNIGGYARHLFKAVMAGQDLDFMDDPRKSDATIRIDGLGVSSVDFDLDQSQQQGLFNSGKLATIEYLQNQSKKAWWKI